VRAPDSPVKAPRTGADPAPEAVDVAAAWPAARLRVAAALGARGVQPADVDDIVQEVALRALRRDERFGSFEHFVRWGCRVAINLHIDGVRWARRVGPPLSSEAPGPDDTARDAERRLALDRLASSIAELSAEDHRLLFDATPAGSREETVRLAVRRHRLRARLAAMVEGLAAAFGGVRRISRNIPTPAKLAVAAVPVVVAELSLGPLLVPPSGAPAEGVKAPPRVVPASLDSNETPSGSAAAAAGVRTRAQAPVNPQRATVGGGAPGAPIRPVVETKGPAQVVVGTQARPEDHITVCTVGTIQVCVNRPRPSFLPEPNPLI